jgi:hypothetical protein
MRYPGGFISSTAPTVSTNSAKGVWTLEEAMQYIRAGQWPVATGNGDPFFQYNTMLLPGQGTNGAQNNTFLDSSTNNFTITRNGNTTQGTFTPFSGTAGNWSNFFDGTGDYLTLPDSTALNLETGDFTIELWFYVTTSGVNNPLIYRFDGDASSRNELQFGIVYNSSGNLVFSAFQSTTNDDIPFTGVSINQWHHCALVRSGNNIYAYLDGVRNPTTRTLVGSLNNGGFPTWIGGYREGGTFSYLNGFISNVRILKGTALYTGSTYTVPTAPLTAITNTTLLTCQNNRFVDNSTNAFTLTANGNVAVTPFQPFGAPTVAYSASTIGGSGYFDGTGDYLTLPSGAAFQFGTGNFTVECWFYVSATGLQYLFDARNSGQTNAWALHVTPSSGNIVWFNGSADWTVNTTLRINSWNHIAYVRETTTGSMFLNGVRLSTQTDSTNYSVSPTTSTIAARNNNVENVNGYLADVRVVKGTAVYSGTTYTVPTAPLTAITNTSLLLSGTNAGIIDNAQDNNLETVGNAQISTTQYKWGASSVAFDGTTDYLIPNGSTTNVLAFGSGAFTIEMWFYVTSFPTQYGVLYDCRPASTNGSYPVISLENNGTAYFYVNTANAISSGSGVISTGRWYHLAVVKSGSSTKMFVNGNQVGSTYADTNTYLNPANRPVIGAEGFTLGSSSLNGYIQDLRITKGYSRYPYNFTAPTAAFPLFWQAAATPSSDPYFDYTTLLLPGNGTNGAQNNTFLDSSTNNFSITRNGNTTQGTFTPFSQTGWGVFANATTTGYVTFPNSTALNLSGGAFTIEGWIYPEGSYSSTGSLVGYNTIIAKRVTGSGGTGSTSSSWEVSLNTSTGALLFYNGTLYTSSTTPAANQWSHFAAVYDGTNINLYLNGSRVLGPTSTTITDYTASIYVGSYDAGGSNYEQFRGSLSNIRVTKGAALYSGVSYTVPSGPLTTSVSSGTVSLLTHQSNRFIDNSTNNAIATVVGSPSVQAFSPFNPTAAYSTSTVGGSGYFDASGDYLSCSQTTPFSFGTGDFCIEAFLNITQNQGSGIWYPIFDSRPQNATNGAYPILGFADGTKYVFAGPSSGVTTSTYAAVNNTWMHVVWTRVSGVSRVFVDGVLRLYNGSDSTNYIVGSNGIRIGAEGFNSSPNATWPGYMSDYRILKGSIPSSYSTSATSVGTSVFTPPAAPLTTSSQGATSGNVSLLCNFTNAGIIDNTAKNNLETVGGASISTTVSKFGGSSMYFDGTGDYLTFRSNPHFAFGTGDFTIEAWVYPTSTAAVKNVCGTRGASGSTTAWNWGILTDSSIQMYSNGNIANTGANSVPINTWTYVAFVRYGGTIYGFVNGVLRASTANTQDFTVTDFWVGATGGSIEPYLGYINDLRITKGIARYAQNFTPPTTAFLTL